MMEYFFHMQDLLVGKIVSSPAINNKAGMMVLTHKHLPCDITSQST